VDRRYGRDVRVFFEPKIQGPARPVQPRRGAVGDDAGEAGSTEEVIFRSERRVMPFPETVGAVEEREQSAVAEGRSRGMDREG
jgi:hypothetical protein